MNKLLHTARRNKNDEFYTQLTDIEKELMHYRKHFKNKVVLCNCDDPRISNFFHYFSHNFEILGLKKLITTCYKNDQFDLFSQNDNENAICHEYIEINRAKRETEWRLESDGDFRSKECIELLKQADIICTNPPFSLFREYITQLVEYGKRFLIIGNFNAITYKEIFPLIKDNKIWLGISPYGMNFLTPEGTLQYTRLTVWFTNLSHKKRNEELILVKNYKGNKEYYPKYDNYNAIEVSKIVDIPKDYGGIMGVPITFLDKYNPEQFEIVSADDYRTNEHTPIKGHGLIKDKDGAINGKPTYARIVIKRR